MDRELLEGTVLNIGTIKPHYCFVRIDDERVRFVKFHFGQAMEDETVVEAAFSEITYKRPKWMLGGGIRAQLGDAGSWTLAPAARGFAALTVGRRWLAAFSRVLDEGGAKRS